VGTANQKVSFAISYSDS